MIRAGIPEQYLKSQFSKKSRGLIGNSAKMHASDLISGLIGAVVKDPVQDVLVWKEYLETVVKERNDWKDIYRASKEID